jgi:hypothetical protein
MLGGINPMGDVPVSFGQPQTFSQGQTQSTITIPAAQRQYYQTPQPNPSPVLPAKEEQPQTDYLAMAKKYAPYVIGAVVLYYLILKNK